MNRIAPLALAAMLVAACGDRNAVAPSPVEPPSFGIFDGSNNGGNPDFFFLPPLVSDPGGEFEAGGFNATVRPVVHICEVIGTACGPTLVTFFGDQISVSTADEHYHVNWHTDQTGTLDAGSIYRIRVLVGATIDNATLDEPAEPVGGIELGFADVDPVANMGQVRNVDTDEYIPLVDGRTLPIKFRIESGASCDGESTCAEQTFTDNGGTLTLRAEGQTLPIAGVQLPVGWLPQRAIDAGITEVLVKLEDVSPGVPQGEGGPAVCHGQLVALLQDQRCIHFTTEPDLEQFARQDESGAPLLDETGNLIIFDEAATVGICPLLPSTDPLYDLMDPFRSLDDGTLPTRLEAVSAAFLPCDPNAPPPIGSLEARPSGILGYASAGLRAVTRTVGRLLTPKNAYAVDLGVGGRTLRHSFYGFAVTGAADAVEALDESYAPGSVVPIAVRVTSVGSHQDDGGEGEAIAQPAPGVSVVFSVVDGGGSIRLPGDEGGTGVTSLPVLTGLDGIATVLWTLGGEGGGEGESNANVLNALAAADGSPVVFTTTVAELATRFTGFVRDAAGAPVPGATVRLNAEIANPPSALTNADGAYVLVVPFALRGPEDIGSLLAEAPGYSTEFASVSFSGGTISQDFALTPVLGIDGILNEPEWATAAIYEFPVQIPGGETVPGTLLLRRSATDLLVAAEFSTPTGFAGATMSLEFDENDDGAVGEDGDDWFGFGGEFVDGIRYDCLPPGDEFVGRCARQDTEEGPLYAISPRPAGTNDGDGTLRVDGSRSTFEFTHPLSSDDPVHDFALSDGQIIGVRIAIQVAGNGQLATTDVPGFPGRIRIQLSSPLVIVAQEP